MTSLRAALADLLENPDLSVDAAAERHLGPGFGQRVNGEWVDRAGFLARIAQLRDSAHQIAVTVLDELVDGDRYAERHVIDLRLADGTRHVQEVFVFAAVDADGRFARIEEVTRPVDPDTLARR